MRNLYHEFFYIPQHGKIREKVMLARVAMTIAIMVVCLVAMSITAYAYFSHNVTSDSNIIKAASFEIKVSVQIKDEKGEAVTVNTSNRSSHWVELTAGTTYFITLEHTEQSTAKTGFVILTAENCDSRYHTQQLGKVGNGLTETVIFRIKPSKNTKVTFCSHWGTSSYYNDYKNKGEELYITQGETVEFAINSTVSANLPTEGTTAPTTNSTSSTEPSCTSTTESTTTSSTETTTSVTTVIETTSTELTEQTQLATESTEATGATTTEVSE